MMKHEFDALVGITTDPECYKKIEAVYMQFDEMFPTKEAIVSFYKKHDMNGIERMYCEALKIQQLEQQLKELRCPVIEGSRGEEMKLTVDELLKNYLQYVGKSVFVYLPEVITSDKYWGTRPAQKKEIVITKICVNTRGVVIIDSHSKEYPLWIFEVYTTGNEVSGESVTLEECPIGLFRWHGVLVLKTEYVDDVGRCECYTVYGGERFWGDGSFNLNQLIVQPVRLHHV